MTIDWDDIEAKTRLDLSPTAKEAAEVIRAAKRDLGDDLGGFSRLDLLADNFPYASLGYLRPLLDVIDKRRLV